MTPEDQTKLNQRSLRFQIENSGNTDIAKKVTLEEMLQNAVSTCTLCVGNQLISLAIEREYVRT